MNWKIALNYYYCRWNEFDSQRHDCETNKKMVFEFSNCKWHLAWTVKSIAVVLVSICESVSVKCLACLLQIAFNIISRTMLSGWYCRSMANQNSTDHNEQDDDNEPNVVDESDDSQDIPVARLMPRIDYKAQYTTLKKKLKFLLYVSTSFSLWLNAVCANQNRSGKIFIWIVGCCRKMNSFKMLYARVNDGCWKWPEIVHFYWIDCYNMRNQRTHRQKATTPNHLKMMCAPKIRKSE